MNLKYPFIRAKEKIELELIKRKLNNANLTTKLPSFFILSSGRSGSTLLRKILVDNFDVYIPPETNDLLIQSARLFFLSRSTWEEKVDQLIDLIKIMKLPEFCDINYNTLQKDLLSLPIDKRGYYNSIEIVYKSLVPEGLFHSIIGDKTPFLILRSNWLLTLFPEAKFIYIIHHRYHRLILK